MDPNNILTGLGYFPVDALVDLWNEEMNQVIDLITLRCPLSYTKKEGENLAQRTGIKDLLKVCVDLMDGQI